MIIAFSVLSRDAQYRLKLSTWHTFSGFHYCHSVFGKDGSAQSAVTSRAPRQKPAVPSNGQD
jgi:hypothetical protein